MNERPEVLLMTHGGGAGLPRLPRTLYRGGCRVGVMSWAPNRFARSRYVDEVFSVDWQAPGGLVEALRLHLEKRPGFYRWIIFGDEPTITDMLPHREEAWLRPWLPVGGDLEDIDRVFDIVRLKTAFVQAAQNADIPIPDSRVVTAFDEACAAAQEVGYPLMLKAAYGCAGAGVRRVDDLSEMQTAYDAINGGRPVVVQSFINGRVGSTCILFDHGRALAWSSSYKHQCWPVYGPSCARRFMRHDGMEELVEKLGRLTNFHGFCAFDWIHRAEDDSLLVQEFNPRPTPTIHLSPLVGVDFSSAIHDMFNKPGGGPPRQPQAINGRPATVYLFPQHLQSCLTGKRWLELARWIPGVSKTDVPWDDPRLLLQQLPKPKIISSTWQRLNALVGYR